jgi:hypothetical protein
MKYLVISIVLGFNLVIISAQSRKQDRPGVSASQVSSPVPIVFGKRDDGLPEKMIVQGKIEDLTFAEVACGDIAWSGTLRVRLAQPIRNYPYDDVFIVVSCFPEFEKFKSNRALYINRPVSLRVSKLYPKYRFGVIKDIKKVPCAYELIINKLDSKRVPFYCTQESISESIESVENKQREKQ